MKPNRMKEKIGRGEPALGASIMFPSPQLVEMLGHAGFDWVLLDCEHGSLSLADVEVMSMAADAVGITAIARPRSNAAADIQAEVEILAKAKNRVAWRRTLWATHSGSFQGFPATAVRSNGGAWSPVDFETVSSRKTG